MRYADGIQVALARGKTGFKSQVKTVSKRTYTKSQAQRNVLGTEQWSIYGPFILYDYKCLEGQLLKLFTDSESWKAVK